MVVVSASFLARSIEALGSVNAEMAWPRTKRAAWSCVLKLCSVNKKGITLADHDGPGVCVTALFDDGSWATLPRKSLEKWLVTGDSRLTTDTQDELEAAEAMCALR